MEREPNASNADSDGAGSAAGRPRSVEFEWDGESSPSMLIVESVADVVGIDATDVGPIYETVDPDALDRLFENTPGGMTRASGRVTFELLDHTVCVHSTGRIVVWPPGSSNSELDER